jgi:uncharacterized protein YndB with AHSA1/START domain
MQKQRHAITIDAPREKVWKTMLEEATYREWTSAFNPGGSSYEGSWEKGSEIRFIGPDPETGKMGGMYARITDNRPNAYVAVEHLGIINDGVVDTTSEEVKKWAPAYETYTFNDKDGVTELVVETDTVEEWAEMFQELWPKALQNLKALAEK